MGFSTLTAMNIYLTCIIIFFYSFFGLNAQTRQFASNNKSDEFELSPPASEEFTFDGATFFLDGLIGQASIWHDEEDPTSYYGYNILNYPMVGFGLRIGNRWLFRPDEKVYHPGIQVTWLETGFFSGSRTAANLGLLNLGFANSFYLGQKSAIHLNFNAGYHMTLFDNLREVEALGIAINAQLKYSYKTFCIGFNATRSGGDFTNMDVVGLSIGGEF